jgi:acetylornithine deacetylase
MEAVDYLQDMIAFNSVSRFSNTPVTDYVEDALKKLGCVTERIEHADKQGVAKSNVTGKLGEGTGGMAYFGHTDVVPADPWLFDDHGPFEPTIKGDKLYGRGSCDMKGSIACMIAAAGKIDASRLKQPIYITCTADEEVGYHGAVEVAKRSELYREMVDGDSNGVIGEPTMLEVVYAHKGTYGLIATSRGRAAHSSTSAGINANLKMIPYLAEMKKIHDELQADTNWQNDEFDPPTISWNIGINDHTKAVNITPPQSVCTVYFRTMPDQDADSLAERARKAADDCGIDFEVVCRAKPLYVDPKSDFVAEVLQLAGKETATTVSYGTDGAMFGAIKKKVIFGPGDIAQAHTHDEWIALEQLDAGTAAYGRLIEHWCC